MPAAVSSLRAKPLFGGIADEPLEADEALKDGFEVGAREDGVAEGVEGDRIDAAWHLQAEAGIAGRLDCQGPEARDGRLRRSLHG